ncbi:MAG: patatin-like phospholipase family protein [Burkholderiaceae bacterium]|nr:patatin-like phospholipase family protein [Burkholderiaceae bacterium]
MKSHRIDLALQGGGAHGAFTWGVLDRLLADERIRFGAVSGSSAGSMNAVALAAGWTEGGRSAARETLRRFWSRVADAMHMARWAEAWFGAAPGMLEPPSTSPLQAAWDIAQAWLAPGGGNPLRAVLQETVDFELVRRCTEMQLFIGATNVRSGKLRVFRGVQIGLDEVLASACLPVLFPAVEIDGEAYWDGGYMANPSIVPLLAESSNLDLLLVQVHPSQRRSVPRTPMQIIDRINEISFHGALVKELRSFAILRKLVRDEGIDLSQSRSPLLRKADALRVHRIEGGEQLDPLASAEPQATPWQHLLDLHRAGHAAADQWLAVHFSDLGRRGTVDIVAEFLQD